MVPDIRCQAPRAQLYFPALTRIVVGPLAAMYADFILVLCRAAPNLLALEIYQQYYRMTTYSHLVASPTAVRNHDTKVVSLHLSVADPTDDDGDIDEEVEELHARPLLALLRRSPQLRELSLLYQGTSDTLGEPLGDTLRSCKQLRDLWWSGDAKAVEAFCRGSVLFPSISRFVLDSGGWEDIVSVNCKESSEVQN